MDQLKNQNRQENNVYLEFLVLFVHLDPETYWFKIKDDNKDKKDMN